MKRKIKFRRLHCGSFIYDDEENCCVFWGGLSKKEEESLSQFTGLFDKNGKEIYEGDIVGMPYKSDDEQGFTGKPRAVVEWSKGSFTVKCFNGNRFDLFAEEGRLEVFGNIYEHKHLLD